MRVVLHLDPISHNWSVTVPDPEHNHSPSGAITAHPAHIIAALAPDTRAYINSLSRSGLLPTQVLTTLRDSIPEISLTPRDIANLTQKQRQEELNEKTPIQWLLEARRLLI
jgi:hypothetical protein